MRFRRLHARVFGVLRDLEVELAPEAAIVFGSNESGKSTFREALETILYGFDPAEREAHPLVRWNPGAGGDLLIEADLERDLGPPLRVERALLSRGQLRVAEAGADFSGRRQGNTALEFMGELPREIFRSVYALELAQLAALERNVQARVDDLLLPQAAALGLRPVGELRAALREDHQALWRPDQRGKPEARKWSEQLTELGRDAGKAAEEERGLRDAIVEQAELKARLVRLEAQRVELGRAHEEAPFLRDLFELAQQRRALGAPPDLTPLGDDPLVDPAGLAREIAALTDEIREPEARLARPEQALDPGELALLAAASDIALAGATAVELRAEAKQAAERRSNAASLRDEARRQLAAVLAQPPGDAELETAKRVPLEALRSAQSQWAAAAERHAASVPAPSWALPVVAVALALAVIPLLLEPWLGSLARLLALGAAFSGVVAVCAAWFARTRREPPSAPSLLTQLFAGLPPAPALLARPSELSRYVDCIATAQTTFARAAGEQRVASGVEASLQTRGEQLGKLCARLGLAAEGDADQRAARLAAALEQAVARERQVAQDRAERSVAKERLDARRPRLELASEHHDRVLAVLRAAEPDAPAPQQAFARVAERREAAEFVRRREAELRRDPRYAAFEQDVRIDAARDPIDAPWSPEASAARERALVACADEIAAANTRLGEIANLLRSDPGGRQARVADRMREAEERLAALRRERDRLALLESILGRAERRFREVHQPPVLQRASSYLERVTRGRWRRIDYEEGADGGLFVTGGGRDEPVRVEPPISRGTLDQIFLCLRLGLLDHLDEGRERPPLLLDDALLRMDSPRRAEVYALLAEISRGRQILLLTCQEWIAAEAEQAMKLRRITLAP